MLSYLVCNTGLASIQLVTYVESLESRMLLHGRSTPSSWGSQRARHKLPDPLGSAKVLKTVCEDAQRVFGAIVRCTCVNSVPSRSLLSPRPSEMLAQLDTLIVDEAGMMSAELLQALDMCITRARKKAIRRMRAQLGKVRATLACAARGSPVHFSHDGRPHTRLWRSSTRVFRLGCVSSCSRAQQHLWHADRRLDPTPSTRVCAMLLHRLRWPGGSRRQTGRSGVCRSSSAGMSSSESMS